MLTIEQRRAKWVQALRSKKYKQATEALQNASGFCCLGVACDIYRRETKQKLTITKNDAYLEGAFDKVRKWFGLRTKEGRLARAVRGISSLADLNDRSFSFDQIADLIEANPEGLFGNEEN